MDEESRALDQKMKRNAAATDNNTIRGVDNTSIGTVYKKLTNDDFQLLEHFISNLKKFEYIPLEVIVKHFKKRFTEKEIVARVKKLAKMKLIERHPITEAYKLRFLGLDCAALHRLVTKDVIKAIGDEIGTGKESKLYIGISEDDSIVVVKFYRIWKSFRNISKMRSYGNDVGGVTWLVKSIVSGRREREALTILNKHSVDGVPKLYGGALHAVVIEYIPGRDLYAVTQFDNPEEILQQIIDIIKEAYIKANIVHGDLSEYNVVIDLEDMKSYIIDWPQYVSTAEPKAYEVLRRDVENVLKFFRRKFRVDKDLNEVIKYIVEGKSTSS
jgi:RIO kinase 2|uniref:non-specific serine/threonine protein kinase n=1 Tax=Ignisphaera aggregans TaxID=334771 RepID=A0A7J2U0J7_9CREN